MKRCCVLLGLILISVFSVQGFENDPDLNRENLVDMINSYREDYKYSPLEISPTLERLAMDYCKKILRTGVINPDSASLDGGLTERIKASGYKGTYQYQVAMQRNDGFSLSYVLSQLFEDSEVLRSSDYQHIGIGYITASQKTTYVIIFGGSGSSQKKDSPQDLIKNINDFRSSIGAPPLKNNHLLSLAAQNHCQYLFEVEDFSHWGRDGSYPADRIKACGYKAVYSGENLAAVAGGFNSQEVVKGWENSPKHREIMSDRHYEEIGIGYITTDEWGYEDLYGTMVTIYVVTFGARDD